MISDQTRGAIWQGDMARWSRYYDATAATSCTAMS